MLGPVARSRGLVAAAALLTLTGAGSALGLGSARDAGTTRAAAAAPFVGPVAVAPPARSVVRADGRLLAAAGALTPVARPMGPPSRTGSVLVGPPVTIGPGSPVPAVRVVQRLLNAAGARLRVDGAWGPATTRAVQRVQERAGLRVDGRVGPATAAVLRR